MEVMKNVEVEYVDGKLVAKISIKDLVVAELGKIKAKVNSGEIDLIPGTDLDKLAILTVIEGLEAAV